MKTTSQSAQIIAYVWLVGSIPTRDWVVSGLMIFVSAAWFIYAVRLARREDEARADAMLRSVAALAADVEARGIFTKR